MSQPLSLHKDADLISYIQGILDTRGKITVRVVEVKAHATDEMVSSGQDRQLDEDGNEAADEAADLGRRRQLEQIMDI